MVITIAGRYGCGARDIARKVADCLNYTVYDTEVVSTAYEMGRTYLDEAELKYFDESGSVWPFDDFEGHDDTDTTIRESSYDVLPLDFRLNVAIQGALNQLADNDNCVIIGRCANYFLRNRKNAVMIFITDSEHNKIRRIIKRRGCDEDTARKLAERADIRREDVYSFFTGEQWDSAENYDLYINTGELGEDGTTRLVSELVRIKENQL